MEGLSWRGWNCYSKSETISWVRTTNWKSDREVGRQSVSKTQLEFSKGQFQSSISTFNAPQNSNFSFSLINLYTMKLIWLIVLQDAVWMSANGNLKCTNPKQIFLLLKSSDRIFHDFDSWYVTSFKWISLSLHYFVIVVMCG